MYQFLGQLRILLNEARQLPDIMIKRPSLFAGFRPQEFQIYINEKLFETYRGY